MTSKRVIQLTIVKTKMKENLMKRYETKRKLNKLQLFIRNEILKSHTMKWHACQWWQIRLNIGLNIRKCLLSLKRLHREQSLSVIYYISEGKAKGQTVNT